MSQGTHWPVGSPPLLLLLLQSTPHLLDYDPTGYQWLYHRRQYPSHRLKTITNKVRLSVAGNTCPQTCVIFEKLFCPKLEDIVKLSLRKGRGTRRPNTRPHDKVSKHHLLLGHLETQRQTIKHSIPSSTHAKTVSPFTHESENK